MFWEDTEQIPPPKKHEVQAPETDSRSQLPDSVAEGLSLSSQNHFSFFIPRKTQLCGNF